MAEVTLELIGMKLAEILKEVEGLQRETRNLISLLRERDQVPLEKRLVDIEQRLLNLDEDLAKTARMEIKAGFDNVETRIQQLIEQRRSEKRIISP